MTTQATTQNIMPAQSGWRRTRRVACILLFVSTVLVLALTWSLATAGSIQRGIDYYLRGKTLFVDAIEKSFGSVDASDIPRVTFHLVNRGRDPVRLIGHFSACNCLVMDDFPLTIGPGETRSFVVRIRVGPVQDGVQVVDVSQEITLFTTSPNQSRVPLRVTGSVRMRGAVSPNRS